MSTVNGEAMFKFIVALALIFGHSYSWAAAYQGQVTNVAPFNGQVFVAVGAGGFDGTPSACPGNSTSMLFVVDPSTAFGRSLIATALAAKLSGRQVYAVGNSVCSAGSMFSGVSAEGLVGIDLKG